MTSTTYQKIPGLYRFDPDARQYTDEATSPELEALWDAPIWLFTEKVDGTNIRIIWDGYRVKFAGRTDNAQIPPHLLEHLQNTFGGEDNERLFEEKFGVPKEGTFVVLYGEGYGPKIQKGGGNYRSDASFVLFDVKVGDWWLDRANQSEIAKFFRIDLVPLLWAHPMTISDGMDFVRQGMQSAWQNGTELHIAEGLVGVTNLGLRNRKGERIMVKIKGRDLR